MPKNRQQKAKAAAKNGTKNNAFECSIKPREQNQNPDLFVSPAQIARMLKGIGCANCGRKIVMKVGTFDCCGSKRCVNALRLVWQSRSATRKTSLRSIIAKEGDKYPRCSG